MMLTRTIARNALTYSTRRLLSVTYIKSQSTIPNNVKATSSKDSKGIKKLMKTYGYSALIVYIGVTLVSLPLCFWTVHSFGETRIKLYLNRAKRIFGYGEPDESKIVDKINQRKHEREQLILEGNSNWWKQFKNSSLLTELVLAYGLHKSLIFVRIPLTAAVTPYMARLLSKTRFNRYVGLSNGNNSNNTFRNSFNDTTKSVMSSNGIDVPKQLKTKGHKWFNGLF